MAAAAPASKSARVSALLGLGALQARQLEVLQDLVTKHIEDPSLTEIANGDDFTVTSTERGVPRYEHSHLVAALDILLMYQTARRGRSSCGCSCRRTYRHDPRTRFVELQKRWLRANAANASVGEEDVRRMCALVRDLMNKGHVFPSRNERSFMHTMAEVYDHLKLQLREVLEQDRTCAELAARVLVLSRNLIGDAIAYLLLAATDLKQTDGMPSLEVVTLWQSLPVESNPLPGRADAGLQRTMRDAWMSQCGSLIVALLTMRWAFRLFDGKGAEEEAVAAGLALSDSPAAGAIDDKPPTFALEDKPGSGHAKELAVPTVAPAAGGRSPKSPPSGPSPPPGSVLALVARVREQFEKGRFGSSGLAGPFREPEQHAARQAYLSGVEALHDLIYLLGDAFVQFHRISDGLGDYGMIRVANWLHPFLEALVDKVQMLRKSLESLNEAVDAELVLAKARGRKVKKPVPTEYMSSRAHAAYERAIGGRECHANLLLKKFDELRARSAPERLPHVMEGVSNAVAQLQAVLSSPQFRARVGDAFHELQPLAGTPKGQQAAQLAALADMAV